MPGVLQEVACALTAGSVPLVVGGFGGCAGAIARYLAHRERPWPISLDQAVADAALDEPAPYLRAKEVVEAYRTELHGDWPHAMDRQIVRELLACGSPSVAVRLVLAALASAGSSTEE